MNNDSLEVTLEKGDRYGIQVFENQPNRKRSLWNVGEVSAFLGISARTIRDMVYRKRIPYRKVGRSVRFSPEEIEQWTLPKHAE